MVNKPSYAEAYRAFDWSHPLRALAWSDTVNLGATIVDRHVGEHRIALRWFGEHGTSRAYSFDEDRERQDPALRAAPARVTGVRRTIPTSDSGSG